VSDAVSDSHDQSYYEIALTNRQVMSIFVVLLTCILLSFLGGVWLGRDAGASVEMASTQSIVAAETGEAPLEELDFFTRRDRAAESETAQPTKPPGQAPGAAKTERRAESADEVPVERVVQSPAPARTPAENSAAQSGVKPGFEAGGGSRGSSTGTAVPVPDAVVIQVFSSAEGAQAQRVVDMLRKGGYPAVLSPVEVAGRTLHRVRIGPYTDPDEARVVAESVHRTFRLETWITH